MLSLMSSPVAVFAAEEVLAPPNASGLWVLFLTGTVVALGGCGFVGFKAWQDIRSVAVTASIVVLGAGSCWRWRIVGVDSASF